MSELAHGGRREGSGRKPGAVKKTSQDIVAQAVKKGITPLEVMLKTMWALWEEAVRPATIDHETGKILSGLDMDKAKEAMAVADRAAPFCHAKIASVEPKPDLPPPVPEGEVDQREMVRGLAFILRKEAAEVERERQPKLPFIKKKITIPT